MSEGDERANRIGQWMSERDSFARVLGIELEEVAPGFCRASLKVTGEMLNAVGLTHGGVTFTLADFAFAVASNSHGRVAVALTAQISYPGASRLGERLIAVAREARKSRRTGHYEIEVRTAERRLVGLFNGTVFRRSDELSDWMNGEIS